MALKPCECCGNEISPYAAFCPSCGRRGDGSWPMPVEVVDIDMKFSSMVGFMVKAAIAAIPAMLILIVVAFAAGTVLAALFMGGHR